VFLPYNYLLDPASRKSLNLSLEGAVLLIDEAHNLESACEEIFSFDLSLRQLRLARAEIDLALVRASLFLSFSRSPSPYVYLYLC
jgi:Rad3-related DNA helicase